jgi:hypothetical protein
LNYQPEHHRQITTRTGHEIQKLKQRIKNQKTEQSIRKANMNRFYTHTENVTNVTFTEDEMELLNRGVKYNKPHKPKNGLQP